MASISLDINVLPGMITLFLAYYQGKPIAGELLFAVNKNCVLNFYTMHLYEYHNVFAVNYLIEHAIRWCHQKGFKFFCAFSKKQKSRSSSFLRYPQNSSFSKAKAIPKSKRQPCDLPSQAI